MIPGVMILLVKLGTEAVKLVTKAVRPSPPGQPGEEQKPLASDGAAKKARSSNSAAKGEL